MEIKYFAKAIGTYLFADILCLFLALTLSAIGGTLFRVISAVCTMAILVCLCINFAVNRAKEDKRFGVTAPFWRGLCFSGAVAIPFVLLGVCLLLARGGVLPEDFYRWYKLADAPFLQVCNLFCADIAASTLSWGVAIGLALLNLLPFAVTWATYTIVRSGFSWDEFQYAHKK